MRQVDLRKLALRLKIIEVLQIQLKKKRLKEALEYWRRFIRAN